MQAFEPGSNSGFLPQVDVANIGILFKKQKFAFQFTKAVCFIFQGKKVMSNYNNLKFAINNNIKTNGNEEITGTVLNSVLINMVSSLGAGYQFMGVATPSTNPGVPDQKVFYLAYTSGTYMNFSGIESDIPPSSRRFPSSSTGLDTSGMDAEARIHSKQVSPAVSSFL